MNSGLIWGNGSARSILAVCNTPAIAPRSDGGTERRRGGVKLQLSRRSAFSRSLRPSISPSAVPIHLPNRSSLHFHRRQPATAVAECVDAYDVTQVENLAAFLRRVPNNRQLSIFVRRGHM